MAESAAQAEIRLLRERLAQAEAVLAEQNDLVDPDQADLARQHEIELRQQEQQENERARQHEIQMAQLQLQIAQANAGNAMPAAMSITQREDKVGSFKKEVAANALKTSFKLEGSSNYESWRDEALT
jgi:hypothetical protein